MKKVNILLLGVNTYDPLPLAYVNQFIEKNKHLKLPLIITPGYPEGCELDESELAGFEKNLRLHKTILEKPEINRFVQDQKRLFIPFEKRPLVNMITQLRISDERLRQKIFEYPFEIEECKLWKAAFALDIPIINFRANELSKVIINLVTVSKQLKEGGLIIAYVPHDDFKSITLAFRDILNEHKVLDYLKVDAFFCFSRFIPLEEYSTYDIPISPPEKRNVTESEHANPFVTQTTLIETENGTVYSDDLETIVKNACTRSLQDHMQASTSSSSSSSSSFFASASSAVVKNPILTLPRMGQELDHLLATILGQDPTLKRENIQRIEELISIFKRDKFGNKELYRSISQLFILFRAELDDALNTTPELLMTYTKKAAIMVAREITEVFRETTSEGSVNTPATLLAWKLSSGIAGILMKYLHTSYMEIYEGNKFDRNPSEYKSVAELEALGAVPPFLKN